MVANRVLEGLRSTVRSARQVAGPRGRRTEVNAAIAALRKEDFETFSRLARRCVLGLARDPEMEVVLQAPVDHVLGLRDHSSASDRVREAALVVDQRRFSPEALQAAETFVRACGLFAASSVLGPTIARAIRRRAESVSRPHHSLQAAVSAIHEGDLDRALQSFGAISTSARTEEFQIATVGRYLDIWARREPANPKGAPAGFDVGGDDFVRRVGTGPFLVYGPGPTTEIPGAAGTKWKVARLLMPEIYSWNSSEDLLQGQADIAYLNHEAQFWLSELTEDQQRDVVDRFAVLVAKKSPDGLAGVSHPGLRVAWSSTPLHLTGSENTVPAIIFDLLAVTQDTVTVIGTTFFASAVSYRSDNRRIRSHNGIRIDSQGRTGLPLERCTTLAKHNVIENRALVRNFVDVGLVRGDVDFSEVVALSDEGYLRRLDDLYGVGLL